MRAKHTPGPWHYERDGHDPYVVDSSKLIRMADVHAVVPASGNPSPRNEAIANARLIAAAPDLLAALASVIPYAQSRAEDMCESGGENDPLWLKANAAIDSARAALAKATGNRE